MKEKKHSYFKDDIRRMLLFYAIIPVVLLTLLCLFIFWGIWSYSIKKTTQEDNAIITSRMETMLDSYIDLIYMLEQQEVFDGEPDKETRVKIFEQIYHVSNEFDKKANVYVFDKNITPTITSTKAVPDFLNGKYAGNWGVFRIMKQNTDEIAIKLLQETGSEDMQLVLGKAMMKNGEINGYTAFVIDSKQFQIDLAKLDSQTVIADETGWVFAANNFSFMDTLERFHLKVEKKNSSVNSSEGGKFYIAAKRIMNDRICIYSISGLSNQIMILRYIIIVLIFVFTAMILFVLISSKKMAAKKTKDLYAMIKTFEKAKEGDLDTHMNITSNDEFETIAEAYNQMLDSLKEQIERNKEMGKLVAFSQTKQLESQFNPHFLFNTLENIKFMCKLNPEAASKMVLNLSILLRYSISNTQEEVTVKEDIAYTENYMSLLKYRFNQRFQYTIDISPEIENCIIPRLLIQPMIENSIKYGFEGRERLVVEITGFRDEDRLIMICSDDGAGMQPAILYEIQQILGSSANKSSHTGLYNINRRLQLKYGDSYGIYIESKHGNGTTLKVILPICFGENAGGNDAKSFNC